MLTNKFGKHYSIYNHYNSISVQNEGGNLDWDSIECDRIHEKLCHGKNNVDYYSYKELWWFIITFMKDALSWEPQGKVFHQVFLLDWKFDFHLHIKYCIHSLVLVSNSLGCFLVTCCKSNSYRNIQSSFETDFYI